MKDRILDHLFLRYRRHNDARALAALFDATARDFCAVACHLVGDPVIAEDVVQETFLAAMRGAARWDEKRAVRAWLHGILAREAAKARRTAARSGEARRLAARGEVLGSVRTAADPALSLERQEVPAQVERALDQLPRRYREVLSPLIQEGRSPTQIAAELGRSPGTVRSQIHRGLERLRSSLPAGLVPPSMAALLPGGISASGLAALREGLLRRAGLATPTGGAIRRVALEARLTAALASKGALAAGALALTGGFLALLPTNDEQADRSALGAAHPPLAPPLGGDRDGLASQLQGPGPGRQTAITPADAPEPSAEPEADPLAAWLARFNEAPSDWRHGWKVAAEIAQLPPDEALAVMSGVWPYLTVPVKEQVLKPFVFGQGHPQALRLLHLAADDPAPSVQERAFIYLQDYAFRDFRGDPAAYRAWYERWKDRPLAVTLEENARAFGKELATLSPAELARRLTPLAMVDLRKGTPFGLDLAQRIRDAGALEAIEGALDGKNFQALQLALRFSKRLAVGEAWLRAHVVPRIEDPDGVDPRWLGEYCDALGRPDCTWAEPYLLGFLERFIAPSSSSAGAPPVSAIFAAGALADMADPKVIPALIELLARDSSGRLNYPIGQFALERLTGVEWNEDRSVPWWRAWWDSHREELLAKKPTEPDDPTRSRESNR